MATFDDLREFFDPALVLPIGGTSYRVESPTAREGLRLRVLMLEQGATLGDDEEVAELSALLGPELARMREDKVSWPEIVHAGRTALLHFAASPEVAELHWLAGHDHPGNPIPPDPIAAGPGVNLT